MERWHIPLALSYGVTGLRDMGAPMGEIVALRDRLDQQRAGGELAPDLLIAGSLFSGPQPWGEPSHSVIPETADAARRQVRLHAEQGVDFIKVHDFLDPDIYRAIVDEADKVGLPAIGHLRADVGPLAATELGQRDFEHIPPELLAYCRADGRARTRAFYDNWFTSGPDYFWRAKAELHDPAGCADLFAQLSERDVTLTPTLILRQRVTEERFALASTVLPAALLDDCARGRDGEAALPDEIFNDYDAVMRATVSELADAGVTLLTGTDRQTYACGIPGWDLIEEMKALADAGLTHRQVLRAATVEPALKAGRDRPGQIVPGAVADLVLLPGNPLVDLDVLETPQGVIAAGAYAGPETLNAMREDAGRYGRSLN